MGIRLLLVLQLEAPQGEWLEAGVDITQKWDGEGEKQPPFSVCQRKSWKGEIKPAVHHGSFTPTCWMPLMLAGISAAGKKGTWGSLELLLSPVPDSPLKMPLLPGFSRE